MYYSYYCFCFCDSMDMDSLPLDHVDILLKNLPNDDEKKKFENYIKDKKDPQLLPPADKFLFEVSQTAHSS